MAHAGDFDLLRRIADVQRGSPVGLQPLAEALGLSPSLLLRKLQPLVEEGLVERTQRATTGGREVLYVPRPFVRIEWIGANGESGAWSTLGETDWSAPLVTRIPDDPSRRTLARFIARLRAGRRLRPRGLPLDNDTFAEPSVALLVFGSAARGESRPDSDIDVLAISASPDDEEEILDVAADASVVSPKPLQVKVISAGQLGRLTRVIADAVFEDGVLVFDGLGDARLYEWLHEGRRARAPSGRGQGVAGRGGG